MNLKELIEKGETQSLEFKESLRLKDEIGETVSAFSNSDGGTVIVGVSNSSSELRKLAKESGARVYWDEGVCEDANLEDIEEEKVKTFLKIAKEERNLRIRENIPTKEALRKLKLVKEDKLTNAAILLFGKEPQRFFTQSEVRCARFKGDEAVKPFVDMKVFGGDILDQVAKALNFTLEHNPKSVWLIPGRPEREAKYLYPPDAVREAIINAICHRDYESVSNVQIRVFDDRVEVWNPGALPDGWTVEKLKEEHESVPKNPLIADHFFLTRLIEKWGTGTIEMIRQCEEWGVPEPEFKDTGTSIVVTFRKSEFTEEFLDSLNLNERQKKAVEFIKTGKKITRSEYEKMFDISERTANRELSDLVELSIFNKIGKGPNVYYVLIKISPNLAKSRQKDRAT